MKFVSDGGPDGETVNAGGSKDSKKEKGEKSGHRVTSWQISVVLNNGEYLWVGGPVSFVLSEK